MQSSQVVGVRKYVVYFLFIFLSGLLSAIDYFSNKTLSNFIPAQVNLISNFQLPDRLLQNEFSNLSSSRADLVAENIKHAVGSAYQYDKEPQVTVTGRDIVRGIPKQVLLEASDVRNALPVSYTHLTLPTNREV